MLEVMVRESKRLLILPQAIGSSLSEQLKRSEASCVLPTRSEILIGAQKTQNLWLTTACGQRLPMSQIGSMFGRE